MFSRLCIRNVPNVVKNKLERDSENQGLSISKIIRSYTDTIIKKYSDVNTENKFSGVDVDNIPESQKQKLQEISKKLGVNASTLLKIEIINALLEKNP